MTGKLFGARHSLFRETFVFVVDCSVDAGKKAVEAFIIGPDSRSDFRGIRFLSSDSLLKAEKELGELVDFTRTAEEWAHGELWLMLYDEVKTKGAALDLSSPVELQEIEPKVLYSVWALGRGNRDLHAVRRNTLNNTLRNSLHTLLELEPPSSQRLESHD